MTSSFSITASTIQSQSASKPRWSSTLPGVIRRAALLLIKRRRIGLEHLLDRASGDDVAVIGALGNDIEKNGRHAGVGDLGGDAGAHDAGADHRRLLLDGGHHIASSTVAMPWPPPMHWVASAYLPFVRLSSDAALPVMRAPVAPERMAERDRAAVDIDLRSVGA